MKERRNTLEWFVLALSCVLTLSVFAYLIRQAWTAGDEELAPQVTVTPGEAVVTAEGHFQVPVVARNVGPAPAEAVGVEVKLEGAPEEEAVEFEVQRLAREATMKVWVNFDQDPRGAGRKLTARVTHARLP